MRVNRRTFILGGAVTAGAAAAPGLFRGTARAANRLADDPFQLGVAAGDPHKGGAVIWTRLATEPLASDGHGGMPSSDIPLKWQVATDEAFGGVVASGDAMARYDWAHAVHIEVEGLDPHHEYFYRFRTTDGSTYLSPSGRFRTAPARDTMVDQLRFGIASCAHYEQAYYHAYQGMADDELDLILFLGDYMYESGAADGDNDPPIVRRYAAQDDETEWLDEYRLQYAQHHADPQLMAAHQSAAWLPVFDDHEVNNNWNRANSPDIPIDRKARAFRAWYENMPVRWGQRPDGFGGIRIYRRLHWGALARFDMLDTRQYRDVQGETNDCNVLDDPERTILGAEQQDWLVSGFSDHSSRWNLLGQQVFFSMREYNDPPESACDTSSDAWDGYAPERDEVAQAWVDRGLPNPVVLTGDVHRHYASNVHLDYDGGDPVAAEFVTAGIASQGSEDDYSDTVNPHVQYTNYLRGYVRLSATPDQLTGDFRVVGDPYTPTYSPDNISTDATFVVDNGTPGLHAP